MTFESARYRLIRHTASNGAWNMAVDEAILESIGKHAALPTLRFYAWKPACLSLGYAQPLADVDQSALASYGWDLVRRPTGGKAILHTDEITYSVIGPESDPRLARGVLESYRILSRALLEGLHRLGIPAEVVEQLENVQQHAGAHPRASNQNPVCFEVPSNYEITVEGKKLIGSAQARRKEGVLQHGSLPLYGDLGRIVNVLRFTDLESRQKAAERLLARATTVEQVIGEKISWDRAALALAEAFRDVLNLELVPGDLTPEESRRAEDLIGEKYANHRWTGKT
jgi:lipoate-protein ligase A